MENKNAQFQKCFFQILRQRKATSILDAMQQSEKLLNNTYNRIHKKTSNEVVERADEKENIREYNSGRKSFIAGDKRKPFKVGDYVRLQIKSKKPGIDYKRYKNKTYSERVYLVKKTTKKAVPAKFWVNGRWRLQADLLKSAQRDQKSIALVEERDQAFKAKRLKELEEHVDKRVEENKQQEAQKKRPTRKAAKAAKMDMLMQKKQMAEVDDMLDAAEDEKQEVVVKKTAKKKPKETQEQAEKTAAKVVHNKVHMKMIKYLQKKGLPAGGSYEVLKARVKKYKKSLLKKKKKAKVV